MKNMKRKPLLSRASLGLFSVIFLLCLLCFVIVEPQSQISYMLFREYYALTVNKNAMLQDYDANLNAHGGYMPEQVDKFLCSRLQSSTSVEELNAIVDFYAFKAGGREGRCIFLLPAPIKQRIVGLILSRIDNYTSWHAASALILIEDIRLGQYQGKASFGAANIADTPNSKYETWWQQVGLPEAKAHFKQWWRAYPTWQQLAQHDPLHGARVQIYSP